MSLLRYVALLLIGLSTACVDRINYEVVLPDNLPAAITGYISNEPGPYQVRITRSFDVESKDFPRIPVSAQRVTIFDDAGNNEVLTETNKGVYQTRPDGIQGKAGRVYVLKVEMTDGRTYESIPDTLLPQGKIERLYHAFSKKLDLSGNRTYGFDVTIDGHENSVGSGRYMWNVVNTYKAITYPERAMPNTQQCYRVSDEVWGSKCNFVNPCSGVRNISPPLRPPVLERVGPCECCTCWYQQFNTAPILRDNGYMTSETYKALPVFRVPVDAWIFMFKTHVAVTQATLTFNTFEYFKRIEQQKNATGSLFQPVSGKIPTGFIQTAGNPTPVNGIFYAAGIDTQSIFISPDDVPNEIPIPTVSYTLGIGLQSCLEMFPNATTVRPSFWED
jgi:hypothetical protein